jgi:hypothetical protein
VSPPTYPVAPVLKQLVGVSEAGGREHFTGRSWVPYRLVVMLFKDVFR